MARWATVGAEHWIRPGTELASILARPREAGRVQHLGSDGHRDGGDAEVRGDVVATFVAHPVKEDLLRGKSAVEEAAVFAIARHQPVILVQDVGGAERVGFLTHVLRVGAHAAGALKFEGDFVEFSTERHLFVELDEIVVRDEVLPERLIELSVFVEDRDPLDLGGEGSGDGHERGIRGAIGRMRAKERTRARGTGEATSELVLDGAVNGTPAMTRHEAGA